MAGSTSGSGCSVLRGGGNMATNCRNRGGNSRVRPVFQQCHQSQPLRNAGRHERLAQFIRIGKQPEQNVAVEPVRSFGRRESVGGAFHRHAERLDQLAVLHARGASGLAGATVQAEFQMAADFIVQGQPAIGDRTH